MSELKVLKVRRETLHGHLNRYEKYITAITDDFNDFEELEARVDLMKNYFAEYNATQDRIEVLEPAKGEDHEIN